MGFVDDKETAEQPQLCYFNALTVFVLCAVLSGRHSGIELVVGHQRPRHLLPGNLCRRLREGNHTQNSA